MKESVKMDENKARHWRVRIEFGSLLVLIFLWIRFLKTPTWNPNQTQGCQNIRWLFMPVGAMILLVNFWSYFDQKKKNPDLVMMFMRSDIDEVDHFWKQMGYAFLFGAIGIGVMEIAVRLLVHYLCGP